MKTGAHALEKFVTSCRLFKLMAMVNWEISQHDAAATQVSEGFEAQAEIKPRNTPNTQRGPQSSVFAHFAVLSWPRS